MLQIHRIGAQPFILLALSFTCLSPTSIAQELPVAAAAGKPSVEGAVETPSGMRFSFDRAPWRDVIKWVADECDLALQYEELPTGSFSYSDPAEFSHQAAIDRVNLFLLPQGYTLVRSGKLLSVINLGDPRSMQQLDALAQLTTAERLADLPTYEVVKCLFPLGELTAEDAVAELSPLNLMTEPAMFNKTNQIMITDTVAKLRNAKAILDAFRPEGLDNGTIMKTFALKHVTAEDILIVARPHLGLATGEMIGIDVSLSADLKGEHIFVTGVEDRVKLIEGLVESLDQPDQLLSDEQIASELRSHRVAGGNIETVYNVLQTLLAGRSLRLSMDREAGSIVALASVDIQAEIAATVAQLAAEEADFEVIPLKSVDPYFAISLLEEMLELPSSFDDPDDFPPDTPKIDADPGNMRLFVRAKPQQIAQIRKIVEGLDGKTSGQANGDGAWRDSNDLRIIPLGGRTAEDALSTAAKFWRKDNPILLYPSHDDEQRVPTERVVGEVADKTPSSGRYSTRLVSASGERDSVSTARYLTDNVHSQAPPVRCQFTPRGLIIQSDDGEALDAFEAHLRTITGPITVKPSPPIVFYLRYTKPDDALRLLAELLDGSESAIEAQTDSLVNGYVSSRNSFLGSLVTSRDGTTTMMADTITVVADPRLNRLIAQGTAEDIELIEGYLSIIDKDTGITDVKTYGSSHVIELTHTGANEVAEAIRAAYATRVASGPTTNPGAGAGGVAPPDPRLVRRDEEADPKASRAKGGSSAPTRDLEPKMTIAVHEASNSLIITAPDQLFAEVEQLVKTIDTRSERSIEVIAPSNSAVLQALLQGGSSSSSSSRSKSSSSSSSSDRARMFEYLKSRGRN
ncbi:MAG: secretin N-terminal domain-containing protein [Pirellulaceae bacterium]